MKNRPCSRQARRPSRTDGRVRWRGAVLGLLLACAAPSVQAAAAAPAWMHALVGAKVPEHTDKTDAVVLYSEVIVAVQPNGTLRRTLREAYLILRPDGNRRGIVGTAFTPRSKIIEMHAWCIPESGKDYEVKEKDAVETTYDVDGGELVTDLRLRLMRIPASVPGSIVGFEVEQEMLPYTLVDDWYFQDDVPVREAHYTLKLQPGWTYKEAWLNHAAESPANPAAGQWSWTLSDLNAVKIEPRMPPWRGIAGQMVVALIPPSGKAGFQTWQDVGGWYAGLTADRRQATPEIKRKVTELTASLDTPLAKMQALAEFVQSDIRYVAIELGIGGHQPHPAADVFTHRYGDCKDKVTLLSTMLAEIGIESYYVLINTQRGSVGAATPPNLGFNHAILAVRLPAGVTDPSLMATLQHPTLGRLLFFDPTSPLTPFGRLAGPLQANYGLLVDGAGGELLELPRLAAGSNSISRTAKLKLGANGLLEGDVTETYVGDTADHRRYAVRRLTRDTDMIKPVEAVLTETLPNFTLLKATVGNLRYTFQPLVYNYSLEVDSFAKRTGDLVLLRPCVFGSYSSAFLEKPEPRVNAIQFGGLEHASDVFEIELPPGLEVDELPPPVKVDYGFASYTSKTEVVGHALRYSRSFDIRELSVPVAKSEKLREFYRIVYQDERVSAVLKQAGH